MEEWKSIPGYEGLYEVSSYGRVKSLEKSYVKKNGIMDHKPEIILSPKNNGTGYFIVCLYKNKTHKYYLIHRLVALTFLPNPNNLPCVNHKDEDKTNNRVDNLEWCDQKYNVNYGMSQEKRKCTKIKLGQWYGLDKEDNKLRLREYSKKWYRDNINSVKERNKEYYQKNKEAILKRQKEYKLKNSNDLV